MAGHCIRLLQVLCEQWKTSCGSSELGERRTMTDQSRSLSKTNHDSRSLSVPKTDDDPYDEVAQLSCCCCECFSVR